MKIECLDHGYVELLDHFGDDSTVAKSARVSFSQEEEAKTTEENSKLIDYLWRNSHSSPFEQVAFRFKMKLPIFVARQFARTRTAKLNEVSARYAELDEEFYIPEDFHNASASVKQGRSDNVHEFSGQFKEDYQDLMEKSFEMYQHAVSIGVAKEEARIILPVATYTTWVWQIDLSNLLKTLTLRCDSHAQYEIRVYANAMLDLIRPIVPQAVEAWERHSRDSIKLTPEEVKLFKSMIQDQNSQVEANMELGERGLRILNEKLGLPKAEQGL